MPIINMAQWNMSSLVRISSYSYSVVMASLPLISLFFSVIWSILFNYESSTSTHCKVPNYLPSISAAIGYPPSEYVWRICVTLHIPLRLAGTVAYLSWNKKQEMPQGNKLSHHQPTIALFVALINFVELFGLLLLTNISSQDNKPLHVFGFVAFVTCSILYMITTCFFHSAMVLETSLQRESLRRKKMYCAINIISFMFALYFYHRHNKNCEQGVYTFFALFEYIVVLSNIGFHFLIRLDFVDCYLTLAPVEGGKVS